MGLKGVGSTHSKGRSQQKSLNDDFEKLRKEFAQGWYERSGAYSSVGGRDLPRRYILVQKENN